MPSLNYSTRDRRHHWHQHQHYQSAYQQQHRGTVTITGDAHSPSEADELSPLIEDHRTTHHQHSHRYSSPTPSTVIVTMDPSPLSSTEYYNSADVEKQQLNDHSSHDTDYESAQARHRGHAKWHRPTMIALTVLVMAAVIIVPLIYYATHQQHTKPPFSPHVTCDIFCTGPILASIQMLHLYNDSKTFVDMPLRSDPTVIYDAYQALPDHSAATMLAFLHQHFDEAASDVEYWNPHDWTPTPSLLAQINDRNFSYFASELNDLWFLLGRRLSDDVYANPSRHTLLPLKHPYMIVPGGRFREFYYWDSYWIVRGLLLCDMLETAMMIVENLIDMVDKFGFVPNGSRQYYLTRSQPPFLALMVDAIYHHSQNRTWLAAMVPVLDREYQFWMTIDRHAVSITDRSNRSHVLNRFYAEVQYPRPESYYEDVMTANTLPASPSKPIKNDRGTKSMKAFHSMSVLADTDAIDYTNNGTNTKCNITDTHGNPDCSDNDEWSDAAKLLFSELTASAETGWDFSSRWFSDRTNISSAETSHIIPVDLNAVLYAVESVLSRFHSVLNGSDSADYYQRQSIKRMVAIDAVLFDNSSNHYIWRDYDYVSQEHDGDLRVLSNYLPLWTRSYDASMINESIVVNSLIESQLIQSGGLLTSENRISQQWDCPNAWPPLQHMVMESLQFTNFAANDSVIASNLLAIFCDSQLDRVPVPFSHISDRVAGSRQSRALSYYLSSQWVLTNYNVYNVTGNMYEKYDVFNSVPGHGGEYPVQAGFGWTNGVALIFIDTYKHVLNYTRVDRQPWPLKSLQPERAVCTASPKLPSWLALSTRQQAENIEHGLQ